jgi:hypothetical protein
MRRSIFAWTAAASLILAGLLAPARSAACTITVSQEDVEEWAAQDAELVGLLPSLARLAEDGSHRAPVLEEALEILWSGAPHERLLVAGKAWIFAPLGGDMETGPRKQERRWQAAAENLRAYLGSGEDHWVLYHLVDSILYVDSPLLLPLFRDALTHPSASIRELAVIRLQDYRDRKARPLLEERWRWEKDPGVRRELPEALARQGSARYAGDFLRLARGEDAGVAETAAWSLARLDEERVVPVLMDWVRSGSEETGVWALEMLCAWPHAPGLLELALEASHAQGEGLANQALGLLAGLDAPEAGSRLVEVALWSDRLRLQSTALRLVDWGENRLWLPALRSRLGSADRRVRSAVEEAILEAETPPDPRPASPFLEGLDAIEVAPDPPQPPWRPDEDPDARVVPPPGREAAPCLEHPSFTLSPETPGHLVASTLVSIEDRFGGNGSEWALASPEEGDSCWVLRAHLELVPEEEGEAEEDSGR